MKIKTQDLTGPALDWAVAKAGGGAKNIAVFLDGHSRLGMYNYSNDWAQGGPIIEQEGVELICNLNPAEAATFKTEPHWRASKRAWAKGDIWYGPTPLTAAMRCYVASKLGDEVDVPDEIV
jgi:hypothetical protein